MQLRNVALVTAAFLAAACGDSREDIEPTGSANASGGLTTATSTGAGGEGTGGDDGPASSAASTTAAASTAASSGTGGEGTGAGGEGPGGAGGGSGGEGGADPCDNDVQDGEETAIDCGGTRCDPCAPGLSCLLPSDCESLICTDGGAGEGGGGVGGAGGAGGSGGDGGSSGGGLFCAVPTCDDGAINGEETDLNCGGTQCDPCVPGQDCAIGDDCDSGVCSVDGVCLAPSCSDDVQNGTETDEDCGGTCPDTCPDGAGCDESDECDSGICNGVTCEAPTCADGVTNGEESDVDCGGPDCNNCGAGKSCDAAADCTSNICTTGTCRCPAGMTTVPILGGGSYCIDPTEITYSQYNAFLTANPLNTVPACGANASYIPPSLWPPSDTTTAANYQQRPVRYVDWCDAAMYCAWSGKELCGSIDGEPISGDDLSDATEDQWFNACSAQGNNTYPYGDDFNAQTCSSALRTVPAAGLDTVRGTNGTTLVTTCQGGVSGVYQMSGNLAEWENSCEGSAGPTDDCVIRGGDYLDDTEGELRCDTIETRDRNTTAADIGFRCCQR